jgi:tRNA(Ile)-lysidine synthase
MSLRNSNVKIKIPKLLKDKLKNKKINKIYNNFSKSIKIKQDFIVGVSGGPDSLALAFFSKIYSLENQLNVKFLIVDHKLRAESTKEAKQVKKTLKKFFINCEILTWYGKKPKNNIQSSARIKRYRLLISKCKKFGIKNILLAHHQDDLLENFFIRILRGSGLKGLTSFDEKTKINDVNILRPLINQKKEDMLFVSKFVFNFFVNDPSNNDKKFQRIRVRKLISEFKKEGLDKRKFANTIKNLKHSDAVINFFVSKNIKKNSFFSKKNGFILNQDFFSQPHEVIFRSLSDIIKLIGKKYYPVRGRKLDKIIDQISQKSFLKLTLGGCIIKKVNQTVIISKEH